MLSQSLCYTPLLSRPSNLRAYRSTKKHTGLNQNRHVVVCAAVHAGRHSHVATLYDLLELSPDVAISDIKQA
eukprot:c11276_g1_i1 orf=3-215(-)